MLICANLKKPSESALESAATELKTGVIVVEELLVHLTLINNAILSTISGNGNAERANMVDSIRQILKLSS